MADDHVLPYGDHEIGARDWGGDGPPLVLLPGGGRSVVDWELAVTRLVARHRVVGVDLPGHGASSEPERWDWDLAVAFVDEVVRTFGLGNPYVAGHSLGGMVAARYGVEHREAPGVINVDGHGIGGPSVPPAFHEARAKLIEQAAPPPDSGDDAWLRTVLDASRAAVAALGIEWEDAEPALLRSFARRSDGSWVTKPSRRFVETLPEIGPELFDVYRTVACPLLIFNCTSSSGQPFEPAISDGYRNALATDLDLASTENPMVEIATVASGHNVLLEQPGQTADLILDFTSRHTQVPVP